MTHQYTKLAEELDALAKCNEALFTASGATPIREAASILRSAASVDVAGLMELADKFAGAQSLADSEGFTSDEDQEACELEADNARAALESALRMALAQKAPEPNTAGGAFFQQCTAFTAPKGTP